MLRQRDNPGAPQKPAGGKKPAQRDKPRARTKLSYHEQRELAALPEKIERMEQEQRLLEEQISNGDFYRQDKAAITATLSDLEDLQHKLRRAYARWEELEEPVGQELKG